MGTGGFPDPSGLGSWFVGGAIRTMLSAISHAVDGAAADALRLTGSMLGATTSPGLLSTWFSVSYWHVAGLSALLTVPFLFAAAVHALVRSDLALLGRAAFGYLPLAAIAVTIAAPLTTLLLSGTDEMCVVVAGAASHDDGTALSRAATAVAGLSAATGSPMLGFFIGLLAVAATIGLWIELLIRAAAVDVIVLLLPLFFAAMVWPARRVWAIRAIETLIALILSKFAIVAVLTLGGAAVGGASSGLSSSLVGATLIVLAVLSPWALLRLLPLHEVAAAAAGGLSQAPRAALHGAGSMWYENVSGAGAEPGAAAGAGLGAEDDAEQAITPVGGLDARGLGTGWGKRGESGARGAGADRPGAGETAAARAGADRPGAGEATPARLFDAETAAGLSAVEGAGRRASDGGRLGDGGPPSLARAASLVPDRRDDDRPPIDEMFGPVEWEGFVIGDEGDQVMQTPRFRAPGAPPDPDLGVVPDPDVEAS